MLDTAKVLNIERLRDSVEELRNEMRRSCRTSSSAVSDIHTKNLAAECGERWLIEFAVEQTLVSVLGEKKVAVLSVHFQRLITYSERNTRRKKYDESLGQILRGFRTGVIVPLKAYLAKEGNNLLPPADVIPPPPEREPSIIFIGQSFSRADKEVNRIVNSFFTAIGFSVITGEKPQASTISKKVMERIDQSDIFVGIFTKRDKLENKPEWNTSPWVIEEKVFAYVKRKKIVLLVEKGVGSIGGILGDYEYLAFDRENLTDLVIRLAEMYKALMGHQN